MSPINAGSEHVASDSAGLKAHNLFVLYQHNRPAVIVYFDVSDSQQRPPSRPFHTKRPPAHEHGLTGRPVASRRIAQPHIR